jgi:hypothetical protein
VSDAPESPSPAPVGGRAPGASPESRPEHREAIRRHPAARLIEGIPTRAARRRRRWWWLGVAVFVALAALVAVPSTRSRIREWLGLPETDEPSTYGIDVSEVDGLLLVTQGELPGSLKVAVGTKTFVIPPLAERSLTNAEIDPWETASSVLAAELLSRDPRPWNVDASARLTPEAEALVPLVVERLRSAGLSVLYHPPRRRR